MPTVDASIVITAPRDKLFALTQDYDARLRWDPFLTDIEFKHGATQAMVGVQVWVRARNRLSMTVEYITLDPPNAVAMKMIEGPWLFRKFSGTWLFRDDGAGRTRVTFRYNFQCRLGPANLVAHSLIARAFRRDIEARLQGLKRSAEDTDILRAF
ncbi:MAG TPA: SRPBCC family protein [Methylomirabilota bacterium]|nr:SRPBCC family protein [Methylomirabilota bacterium]